MNREEMLTQWVIENISKRKTKNLSRSSYGLKHSAEKAFGFYIPHDEIIEVMGKLGYTASPVGGGSPNYVFNASYTILKAKERIK